MAVVVRANGRGGGGVSHVNGRTDGRAGAGNNIAL